jgi:hypothetical protein
MERVPRGRPKCCAGTPGTCLGREAIALRIGAEGGLGFRADLSMRKAGLRWVLSRPAAGCVKGNAPVACIEAA